MYENLPGEEIYAARNAALDELDFFEQEYYKAKKRQNRYKKARARVFLAPLAAACVIATPAVKKEMSSYSRILTETAAFIATGWGFIVADRRRQDAFFRSRAAAKCALPIVEDLKLATPNWVEEALEPDDDFFSAESTEAV